VVLLFLSLPQRIASAAALAFVLSIALVPLVSRYGRRRRFVDREGKSDSSRLNELHAGKRDTPVLGGLAILAASLAAILLFARTGEPAVLLVVLSLLGLGALGLADDWAKTFGRERTRGLTPRQKLAAQLVLGFALGIALVAVWEGPTSSGATSATAIHPPFLADAAIELGAVFFVFFVALVITASSNAVNLTDGLDGLASGCLVFAWLVYLVLAYVAGRADWCAQLGLPHVPGAGEVAVVCGALAGATLGFLWFNAHPAEVFMGDAGSLPLGGALGLVAVVTKHELLLPIVGGVFVAEALSVMVQVGAFKLTGRRAFRCAPLHHHFEFEGWPETKVVARFHIAAAFLAVLALATLGAR
jgi:phospho-N-acetylmuramoyl-pentapeptide-transferase